MPFPLIPLLSFLIASSFTPGPNNLACAALGLEGKYRRAFPYILGVYLSIALLLFLTGMLRSLFVGFFERYELGFRIAGMIYLFYMALGLMLKKGELKQAEATGNLLKGFFFQLVNPKAVFFILTLQGLFFAKVQPSVMNLAAIALTVPVFSFLGTSTWALAGSLLSNFLKDPEKLRRFNILMGLLLIYTGISLLFFHA